MCVVCGVCVVIYTSVCVVDCKPQSKEPVLILDLIHRASASHWPHSTFALSRLCQPQDPSLCSHLPLYPPAELLHEPAAPDWPLWPARQPQPPSHLLAFGFKSLTSLSAQRTFTDTREYIEPLSITSPRQRKQAPPGNGSGWHLPPLLASDHQGASNTTAQVSLMCCVCMAHLEPFTLQVSMPSQYLCLPAYVNICPLPRLGSSIFSEVLPLTWPVLHTLWPLKGQQICLLVERSNNRPHESIVKTLVHGPMP